MTVQTRLLCTQTVAAGLLPQAGGLFSATQGSVYDIPGDASGIQVQTLLSAVVGYSSSNSSPSSGPAFVLLGQSGPTTSRPTYPSRGALYVDTTAGLLLTFDGTNWRDATGTSH